MGFFFPFNLLMVSVHSLVGYPKAEQGEDGGTTWSLSYVDETITTAVDLLDSAVLKIARDKR